MKTTSLITIARRIERTLGIYAPRMSTNEMTNQLETVAGHCRTKKEAASLIAEEIYNHPINGDFPALDSEILNG